MDVPALIASVAVSIVTVLTGGAVARRFQKLGGGEAQERLNTIRKELDDAMTDKVDLLESQFVACKRRLAEVEEQLKAMRVDRRNDRQEIADLHLELRKLRPDRRGARDRGDD